ELGDVRPLIALLGRLFAPPPRRDRLAEEVDLAPDVVEIVLALDVVPREPEEARDGVSVRGVPSRPDRQRPGRVRGHELHLDPLAPFRAAAAVRLARLEDLAERGAEPGVLEPEVDEPRARDLGARDLGRGREALGEL